VCIYIVANVSLKVYNTQITKAIQNSNKSSNLFACVKDTVGLLFSSTWNGEDLWGGTKSIVGEHSHAIYGEW